MESVDLWRVNIFIFKWSLVNQYHCLASGKVVWCKNDLCFSSLFSFSELCFTMNFICQYWIVYILQDSITISHMQLKKEEEKKSAVFASLWFTAVCVKYVMYAEWCTCVCVCVLTCMILCVPLPSHLYHQKHQLVPKAGDYLSIICVVWGELYDMYINRFFVCGVVAFPLKVSFMHVLLHVWCVVSTILIWHWIHSMHT